MENYKINLKFSHYHCMHRLLAKPSVLTSSSAEKFAKEYQDQVEGRDQVPKLEVLLILAQKECFKLVAKNLLTLYELVAFVASRSERVKNYARFGDSTPWPCTFREAFCKKKSQNCGPFLYPPLLV